MTSRIGNKLVCFAGNASYGIGGQGEFLRQMVYVLDLLPRAKVYSRQSKAETTECVNLPFDSFPLFQFNAIQRVPWLRRRRDWLTLLSDINFDRLIAAQIGAMDLFDGIMGQCCETFIKLKTRGVRLMLTC